MCRTTANGRTASNSDLEYGTIAEEYRLPVEGR
jgi:hypothetical protein